MDNSLMSMFVFVLILVGAMAGTAFFLSQRPGHRRGNALLESLIWGGSLIACAGADYFLITLNSNHVWA